MLNCTPLLIISNDSETRPRNESGNVNAGFKAADGSNGKADMKGGSGKDVERGGGGGDPQQSPQQSNGSNGSGPRSLTGGTRV